MDYFKSVTLQESSASADSAVYGEFLPLRNAGGAADNVGVGEAALGNIAKYSSIQQPRGFEPYSPNVKKDSSAAFIWALNQETGELTPFTRRRNSLEVATIRDPGALRLERFALQSAVRRLMPDIRTAKCLRYIRPGLTEVDLLKSTKHQSVFYNGLQVCASVWACPVCAAKVSERRRVEVLAAMDQHKAAGGDVLLLTLTNPHTARDDLIALLKAQALAMSRLNSNRSAKRLFEEIGCIGTIRATEVTHGVNGWHPHFHILLFVRAGLDLATLRPRFYAEWANACRLAKLPTPSEEHGVSLDDGSKAAEYATKGVWGLEHEMTKGHIKKARKGHSPFDLLRLYLYGGHESAGELFVEYAKAFKGKKQLQWSNGLKVLFAIDERSDEETAAAIEEDAIKLGSITFDEWQLILKHDLRGDLVELANLGGWEPVRRLLDSLVSEDKRKRKVFDERKRE